MSSSRRAPGRLASSLPEVSRKKENRLADGQGPSASRSSGLLLCWSVVAHESESGGGRMLLLSHVVTARAACPMKPGVDISGVDHGGSGNNDGFDGC